MKKPDHPTSSALREAFAKAGGRVSLMEKLNARGHEIKSISVIGQWLKNGVPAPYGPDIEVITGVTCERLCPEVKWGIVRNRREAQREQAQAGAQ